MLTINTNMMALNVARNFGNTYSALATSTNRLSTGLRINTSADDAAGLAISELMRTEVAALNQGIRNAGDAQSMLYTADGALSVIDEKLIRMKELAEQAATGTYTSAQRTIIHNEFATMRSEIDRIAQATKFNSVQLLTGSLSAENSGQGLKIHFGPTNDSTQDYYFISLDAATSTGLGIDELNISTQSGAQAALTTLDTAVLSKDTVRADIGAYINRLSNTISQLSIQKENIQAAESRVRDADIALEMTQFVNNQIKSQAAIAMLSQANMLPQMALTLIGA